MAKKSLINKANRTPKFAVRQYKRCRVCGRVAGVSTEICHVSYLFSWLSPPWRDPRRGKVKLVVLSGQEIRCGVAYI